MRKKLDITKFPPGYEFLVTDRAVHLIREKKDQENWGNEELARRGKKASRGRMPMTGQSVKEVIQAGPGRRRKSKLIPYLLLAADVELTLDLVLPVADGETAVIVDQMEARVLEVLRAEPEIYAVFAAVSRRLSSRLEEPEP